MLELIERKYLAGADIPQICKETGFSRQEVTLAVDNYKLKEQAEESRKEITRKIIEDCVPDLKAATTGSIKIWLHKVQQVLNDPIALAELSIKDAKMFLDAAQKSNEIARLEEGKSTQNIRTESLSMQQVQVMLTELATIDPVFNYPVEKPDDEEF